MLNLNKVRWGFAIVSLILLFLTSCGGGTEPPDIYEFNPASGVVGTTVTINGLGFDPGGANNIVKFNGTIAPITSSGNNTLVVTVPAGATTGSISVTVNGQTAISSSVFTVN